MKRALHLDDDDAGPAVTRRQVGPMMAGQEDTGLGQIAEAIERDGVCLAFVPQPALLETCWYTIGLTDHGHPELILFGLPPDISRAALHALALEVIEGRRRCVAGQHADDVLEGHPVTFVAVTEPDRHLPFAAQFYAGTGAAVEALQIVWPDRYHRWPWQPGARGEDMPVLGQRLPLWKPLSHLHWRACPVAS